MITKRQPEDFRSLTWMLAVSLGVNAVLICLIVAGMRSSNAGGSPGPLGSPVPAAGEHQVIEESAAPGSVGGPERGNEKRPLEPGWVRVAAEDLREGCELSEEGLTFSDGVASYLRLTDMERDQVSSLGASIVSQIRALESARFRLVEADEGSFFEIPEYSEDLRSMRNRMQEQAAGILGTERIRDFWALVSANYWLNCGWNVRRIGFSRDENGDLYFDDHETSIRIPEGFHGGLQEGKDHGLNETFQLYSHIADFWGLAESLNSPE